MLQKWGGVAQKGEEVASKWARVDRQTQFETVIFLEMHILAPEGANKLHFLVEADATAPA